ncbi:MAG: hypothetical protein JW936_08365 [Sedimentisphaerales bacterium]|nr:hypothetical protein [Sedimentisphaerales bacterium]
MAARCKIANGAAVIERFRLNCDGFWGRYRWLVLLFSAAMLCDGVSTVYFMVRWGPGAEVHPGVRLTSEILGPVVGPILSVVFKAGAGIMLAIYLRRIAVYILLFGTGLAAWAAWYNFYGYRLYTPLILYIIPC